MRLVDVFDGPFLLGEVNLLENVGHDGLKLLELLLCFVDHVVDSLHDLRTIVFIFPESKSNLGNLVREIAAVS